MSNRKRPAASQRGGAGKRRPVGVWDRGSSKGPANPIRVRTKRLDEIDGDKIALAYWLLAKKIVEDSTELSITEEQVRRYASEIDDQSGGVPDGEGES